MMLPDGLAVAVEIAQTSLEQKNTSKLCGSINARVVTCRSTGVVYVNYRLILAQNHDKSFLNDSQPSIWSPQSMKSQKTTQEQQIRDHIGKLYRF